MIIINRYLSDISLGSNDQPSGQFTVQLPENAQILDIQRWRLGFAIWALVDPEQSNIIRKFRVFETGRNIDNLDDLKYIKTVHDDGFVCHIFEIV